MMTIELFYHSATTENVNDSKDNDDDTGGKSISKINLGNTASFENILSRKAHAHTVVIELVLN